MSIPLDIELAAEGARMRSGQAEACPVDPFAALAAFSVRLLRQPSPVEGAYAREDDLAFALINTKTHYVRQRFTAAHELGHHILHRDDSPRSYVDVSFDSASDLPEEDEADAFAAAFLMPEGHIKQIASSWPSAADAMLVAVAQCHASKESVTRRFGELGLANASERDDFLRDRRSLAKRMGDLNDRHPGTNLSPPPNRDMSVTRIDPGLERLVRRVREIGLLEHPEALLDLTPTPSE
jgi:Zn-dependent peptidase ImmA (M78 family)